MKYVRGFFGFWRRFIVGDDSRIAVTVMWSLIMAKSLLANTMNAWLMMPMVVIVLLYVLIYEKIADHPFLRRLSTLNIMLISCAIPFVVTTALPVLLFRINNGAADLRYTWLPASFYLAVAALLLAVLYRFYKKLPMLTIFVFGAVAVLLITVWQDVVNVWLQSLVVIYPAVIPTAAVVITVSSVAGCIYSFADIRAKATKD